MNYRIIRADSASELEEKVIAAIAEGWTPQGGVTVAVLEDIDDGYTVYVEFWAQAAVKWPTTGQFFNMQVTNEAIAALQEQAE